MEHSAFETNLSDKLAALLSYVHRNQWAMDSFAGTSFVSVVDRSRFRSVGNRSRLVDLAE